MLDSLTEHLRTASSPLVQQGITEAVELFEQYGLQDYNDAYDDLLMSADNADMGGTTLEIVVLTREFQNQILHQLQITLGDSTTVSQANLVLRAFRQLETTELKDQITALTSEDGDNLQIVTEIVALLSGEKAENLYEVIVDVGDSLIFRIQTLCESEMEVYVDDNEASLVKAKLDRLTRFKYFYDAPVMVYDRIVAGDRVGELFAYYYTPILEILLEQKATARQIAANLFAATLISEETTPPSMLVGEALDATFHSLQTISPIGNALQTLILEFQAYETSGVKQVLP